MRILEVRVPDLGEAQDVAVVEVLVAPGASVEQDQGLVTLESEKASMDIPSPAAGQVREIRLKVGDTVSEGDLVAILEVAAAPATGAEVAGAGGGAREDSTGEPPIGGVAAAPAARETGDVVAGEAARALPLPPADLQAEVLVLGAGPGGYTAAFRAADLGKRVVLVERYATLGGVCLNVGCIPSKALLHAARVLEEVATFAEHGIEFGQPRIDLDQLREWKAGVVGRLTGGLAMLARQRKVQVVRGEGRFVSDRLLAARAGDGETTIAFESAIIAAGSRGIELPGIPANDPRVMDSTAALELAEVPARLLVVGGGIIGLELATVYAGLGSAVTVVELTDGLLPGVDRDLVRPLERRLRARLAAIHVSAKVARVRPSEAGLEAFLEGPGAPASALFDRVLVAVGRRPNGDRIGAEAAGIRVSEKGVIPVDRRRRTNVPHIFAIGDAAGAPMLAHKASHEGKVAAEAAAGLPSAFDARGIPSVAYTDPEVAWVGLTELEARERGVAYEKGTFPWSASGRSLGMGRDEGMTKILFDPATRRLLGAGVVGPQAGDLISELTLALEMGCEAADIGLTIHPHPTLSETVAFAAEAFEGTLTELYLPRRR